MEEMSRKTYLYGRKMVWPKVAKRYKFAFLKAVQKNV